jgi:hypothetical protein
MKCVIKLFFLFLVSDLLMIDQSLARQWWRGLGSPRLAILPSDSDRTQKGRKERKGKENGYENLTFRNWGCPPA